MKDSSTATERVGRYQLLEPIGSGPNGMVSRAKVFGVAGFERQFAVKRFLPELTVGASAQALSQAARSYGSLEHPRIARMSEFGVAQGQTFTAVELVTGLDVFRLMQESKLAGVAIPPGGALALVSQAARAVGYAHGRGLSHLGLSPTNVIVTADGDVKVTDFGILASTMPANPVESQRLATRIPYLAPEQLSGEATSAATDVFVLGVLAYELVTGHRAFRGDTPAQISQAILAGPPAEPPLPRPIVRVLQRCLARSPFERFPDARALADALDAALRVAPVPGTRKDIGAQIKTTLDRYATLNEGNLSGMVALGNLGNQQQGNAEPADVGAHPFDRPGTRPEARTEPSAMPIVPSIAPSSTIREMPRPFTTVPGLAPPPIPVPPGVTPPPPAPAAQSDKPPTTMLGISAAKKPQIPSIVPSIVPPVKKPNGPAGTIPSIAKPAGPPPPPPAATKEVIEEPSGLIEVDDSGPVRVPPVHEPDEDGGAMPPHDPNTIQGVAAHAAATAPAMPLRLPKPTPGQNFESPTGEMSSMQIEKLNRRATTPTGELGPQPSDPDISVEPPPSESQFGAAVAIPDPVGAFATDARQVANELVEPSAGSTMPGHAPAPAISSARLSQQPASPSSPATSHPPGAAKKSKAPAVVLTLLLLGGLGAGGYYFYTTQLAKKHATQVAAGPGSSTHKGSAERMHVETGSSADTAGSSIDTGSAVDRQPGSANEVGSAKPVVDTGSAATGSGAGSSVAATAPDVAKPSASSDQLQITSKPAGARVFIDGADQGTTPVKLPGTSDRHTLAVLLPGHDLYVAEVDGHGVFDVDLKAVTPTGGHAGIKVLKCKKERYYVYVDGNPTGQTCPTERIDTKVGPHTVEVYDIVTETRRKFDINVKDERLSERVRIEQ